MTNAALAQRRATVIGWVDDQPITRTLLDDRLAVLRAGKGAAALPAPDTREGRQLVRWTAHVLFTEHLCAAWARQHEVPIGELVALDALSAIQLGSITAAAWRTHPAVSAVYRAIIDDNIEATRPDVAQQWLLRIASGPTPEAASAAEPVSIGWTTLTDLPLAIAAAARDAARSAPVASGGAISDAARSAPVASGRATRDTTRSTPVASGGAISDTARSAPVTSGEATRDTTHSTPVPPSEATRDTTRSTPVASGGAWHVVVVDEVDVRPIAGPPPVRRAGTALRAFARWLDQQRARSVRVADGFEHPGDPGQPDNTHQH